MENYKGTDIELNTEILHDLLSKGVPKQSIATDLGISVHALNKTIAELQQGQGLLLKYRELQHLQLTGLQAKVLDAITPEKIEAASLIELVSAFKVLKDKELVINGKATSITGIVGYLVQLEKEEAMQNSPIDVEAYEEMLEACGQVVEDNLPKL
jgi:biotin operon repressor